MRLAVLAVGAMATILAIVIQSIYGLWFLCADLVYVILFPQLLAVVYLKDVNIYGSFTGYVVGVFFRLTGGESLLHLPALIKYPYFDEATSTQLFPFKTMSMLLSLVTLVSVSYLTKFIFENGVLPECYDFMKCMMKKERSRDTKRSDVTVTGSVINLAYAHSTNQL